MVYSVKLVIVFLLGIAALVIGVVFYVSQVEKTGQPAAEKIPEYFSAPPFELTDSSGNLVRRENLEGSVWLVDFIFTRCMGPCPIMTQRMKSVQDRLKDENLWSRVKLVSITVDPAHDTPEILNEYARTWRADTSGWIFLTGQEEYTLDLIRTGFKMTAQKGESGVMGRSGMPNILHSTSFLLIDKKGTVRKILPLDEPNLAERVAALAKRLLDEDGKQNLVTSKQSSVNRIQ